MTQPLGLQKMIDIAKSRNGLCLSKKYKNLYIKLKWQCNEGHIWEAPAASVINHWCPKCNIGVSERICCGFFEKLFNKKFIKIRPKWLDRLELDGYCKKLKIAFEYNGPQHYILTGKFNNKKNLKLTKTLDKKKKKICLEKGVNLIIIPYTVNYNIMQKYIIQECKKLNIIVPNKNIIFDYKKFNIYQKSRLEEMKVIAINNNGKLLSKSYINAQIKLKWQCKEGHIWKAMPMSIKQSKSWCPFCAGNNKKTIDEIKKLAVKKSGKLLSKIYNGMHNKLRWQCNKGHIWKTTPHRINLGSWCPICNTGISKQRIKNILGGFE